MRTGRYVEAFTQMVVAILPPGPVPVPVSLMALTPSTLPVARCLGAWPLLLVRAFSAGLVASAGGAAQDGPGGRGGQVDHLRVPARGE